MAGKVGCGLLLAVLSAVAAVSRAPFAVFLLAWAVLVVVFLAWYARTLRRDVTAEDCGACFICAAAMLAAANYREAAGMGSVQAFRVGDVSVTPGANSARALRDAAERLMQPFCAGGLSCRGVLG